MLGALSNCTILNPIGNLGQGHEPQVALAVTAHRSARSALLFVAHDQHERHLRKLRVPRST